MQLYRSPKFLIVHLKRFNLSTKIKSAVNIPNVLSLGISHFSYNLVMIEKVVRVRGGKDIFLHLGGFSVLSGIMIVESLANVSL